jgi:hypothetical protein
MRSTGGWGGCCLGNHQETTISKDGLVVQVSEWRCGKVTASDATANSLVLAPWPNPGIHPVEEIRLAMEVSNEV